MRLRVLSSQDLRRALPMEDTIEAMKSAYEAYSTGRAVVPQRLAIGVPPDDGVTLVKPASIPQQGLGAKLVSVFPGNTARGRDVISGIFILLDPETGEPIALCEGAFLTAWRTGAASGAATDLLARKDAEIGALVGCGAQGRKQIIGIDACRAFKEIRVFDLNRQLAESLASEMESQVSARLVPVPRAQDAVEGADVICLATTSRSAVIESRWLEPGAHINGVGSFTPQMHEIDEDTLANALIAVDSRQAVLAEAGEMIDAVAAGVTCSDDWVEIGELVAGQSEGRRDDRQVTVFKSVGLAVQDVAAGALALRRADELGLGSDIEIS